MNSIFPIPILAAAFFATAIPAMAQGDGITLDGAVRLALRQHPQLQAARLEVDVAEARLIDAGKLPNPELELSTRRSNAGGDDREGSVFAGFSQKFPITDRLSRAREVREADVRLARAEVTEAERKFIADVQRQFILALAAKAKIEVLAELEAGTTAYVDLAKRRLEVAQGSQLDVSSAQIEAVLARQAKQQAQGELREAEAALRPLLGLAPDAGLSLSGDLSSVIAALRKSTRLSVPKDLARADVIAAQLKLERAETAKYLAHAERFEDWEWFAGYENERSVDEPIGADRDHFFGVGLRIPLPFRNKGEGRMAEAKAQAEQTQQLLAATRLQARGEVASAIEAVRKAQSAGAGLRDETLPLLEEREARTREAYEQAVIDFTAVLQLQQQRARLREALLASDRDHALALARLQNALGANPNLKTQPSDS